VTGEGTGGRATFFRPIVACTSPPVSAKRFATSRSVSPETSSRAAMTSLKSISPIEVSNASSTRARLIIEAGCTPVVVIRTNSSRSASVNNTGRFFCEGITNILSGRGKDLPATNLPTRHPRTQQRHATSGCAR
jgi:hypothetical protein